MTSSIVCIPSPPHDRTLTAVYLEMAAKLHAEFPTLGLTKHSPPLVAELDIQTPDCPFIDWEGDLLAIGLFDDSLVLGNEGQFESAILSSLNDSLGGVLLELVTEEGFVAQLGQTCAVRLTNKLLKRLALVGLGSSTKPSATRGQTEIWRAFGVCAARLLKPLKGGTLGLALLHGEQMEDSTQLAALEAIVCGAILGTYEDTRFKSQAKPSQLRHVSILSLGSGTSRARAVRQAVAIASGVVVAKQLVAAPANVLTPGALADAVISIALAHSDVLTATILEKDECEFLGMGAFLGVAHASDLPPKFIHLKYKPPDGQITKRLAVIGKGICFDSGGYNIKAGAGCAIEFMKTDMGGAAAAFGAAKVIGDLKPKGVMVHFISAACENMVSGRGMRPGDVVTASNGKTIEVNNTDAEGRLTLADALVYACHLNVDAILDLATLTGAMVVALGNDVAGVFTPSDSLADELLSAAKSAGEKLWRMPLVEEYKEALKSPIADLVNTGGRPGGAIKAALFLQEFVEDGVDWAHMDIAGPAFDEKKGLATGYGVGTIVSWIRQHERREASS